jgi:PAS domain S-box-containing protein
VIDSEPPHPAAPGTDGERHDTSVDDARSADALSSRFEQRSGELHRLLVESVRDYAIFALDPTGLIASWNAGAQRAKGYTADEIIGKHFSIFYPPEKIAEGFPETELREAARDGRFEDEGWRLRKDGTRFWANVVITALYGPDGELVGYAKVTRDLTERKAAEQRAIEDARRIAAEEAAREAAERQSEDLSGLMAALRRQTEEADKRRREAEEANRAKSQFLAAMSHELRTPLNAIGGYAELLDLEVSGPLSEQQHEYLTRIRRSQQLLLGIITDILNFSRIEAGSLTYDMADVEVAAVLRVVADLLTRQADAGGVALDVSVPGASPVARVDESKLEQIILNLVSNAVKFTPEGGAVRISAATDEDRVTIRVSDTGIGIPADKLEAVFEPFVQVGRSLTSPREGTGLGLAISRDLARAMGGELTASSSPGEGSEFTLSLPAAR